MRYDDSLLTDCIHQKKIPTFRLHHHHTYIVHQIFLPLKLSVY
jgi:hypothetical protein